MSSRLEEIRRRRRPRARRVRWGRVAVLLAVLLLLATGLVRGGCWLWDQVAAERAAAPPVPAAAAPPVPAAAPRNPEPAAYAKPNVATSRLNILLLGVDDGEAGNAETPRRADSLLLANVDGETGKVVLLSLPRDTQVLLPGHKELDKLGHAYAYGGSALAVKAVEDLLQLPVHHCVALQWPGFIRMLDALGGLDLYVERDMDYEDPYADLAIHLTKGYQHLDGLKAGQYVRFRNDELGDIGRIQRQQRFLRALAAQACQWETVLRLPALHAAAQDLLLADLKGSDWLRLTVALRHFDRLASISPVMLPGYFATEKNISYWKPQETQIRQLVATQLLEAASANEGGTK